MTFFEKIVYIIFNKKYRLLLIISEKKWKTVSTIRTEYNKKYHEDIQIHVIAFFLDNLSNKNKIERSHLFPFSSTNPGFKLKKDHSNRITPLDPQSGCYV